MVTETTSKLINQKNVRAVIEYLKYSYFGEELYARNFFALAGILPESLPRCSPEGDLVGEVTRLIERYGLYDGDLNLLRFLEQLARYRDIEQFLFEYERLDATAAQADLNGVRVLTVHKSKGLEYEHVIVLDRLGKPSADRDPIIYEYEGIRLQNLYLRMKNRAELDPEYARALEKEEKLAREDALNALYVAFTRAKRTLYVLQRGKGSKFEMLGLGSHRRGTLSVETPEFPREETPAPLPYRALHYGTQTELLGSESEEEGEHDHRAILFGTALHYTLEMMPDFTQEALEKALPATRNRYGAQLEPGELEAIERRIGRLLETEAFRTLCDGTRYREQPLTYGGELRYIDLLVEREGVWTVVDYKSSLQHGEAHRKQVGFYKKAVAEITKSPVRGCLCYLLEEGVTLVDL